MPPPSYRPLDSSGNETFPDVIQRDGVCYIKTTQTTNSGVTLNNNDYNSFESLQPCFNDEGTTNSSSSSVSSSSLSSL